MMLSNELLFLAAENSALANAKGGFAKQVVVLVLEEKNAANNQDFLAKVLAAAQLDLAKDTLFAEIPAGQNTALAPDLKEHRPKQVLIFGVSPAQLGLTVEVQPYQLLAFYGTTWLFADKLSILEPDKTKKTQLWNALKQLFLG